MESACGLPESYYLIYIPIQSLRYQAIRTLANPCYTLPQEVHHAKVTYWHFIL